MLSTRTAIAGIAAAIALTLTLSSCASTSADASADGGVDAATATSVSAFGDLAGLEEAAKAEGALNVIALPRDWANYGAVLDAFSAKYPEISITEASPDASSAEEIQAADNLAGQDTAPDVFDVGAAVALANTDKFAPYQVETWADIPDALKEQNGLGVGDYGRGTTFSPRIHLLGSDLVPDITPVLPSIDTLVTDYSSIAYDFSLTGGTVLFLAPDVASYAASRGLYEPYGRFSGGREVNTWDEVLGQLRRAASESSFRTELAEHTAALARRFFDHTDGNNTVRVYGEIVSRLKGTA